MEQSDESAFDVSSLPHPPDQQGEAERQDQARPLGCTRFPHQPASECGHQQQNPLRPSRGHPPGQPRAHHEDTEARIRPGRLDRSGEDEHPRYDEPSSSRMKERRVVSCPCPLLTCCADPPSAEPVRRRAYRSSLNWSPKLIDSDCCQTASLGCAS